MTSQKNKDGVADIKALENILDTCKLDLTAVDEVWPNLYIGNIEIAQNRNALKKMGITHILNAAHSKQGSIGDQSYYGNAFVYYGIPAEDSSKFDLSVHFQPACDFIHKALKKEKWKGACALHHGSEPLIYPGPGLPHVTSSSHSSRCNSEGHSEKSYLSQQELSVPPS